MKQRKTLQEMATTEQTGKQVSGHPADNCPHCGAGMFVDGTSRSQYQIIRYVECRACHRRFMTVQKPATIVKEIGANSASGMRTLQGSIRTA